LYDPSHDVFDGSDRIIVACAPKTGSTYVASVLQRYFSIAFGNLTVAGHDWAAEQNLIPSLERQIENQRFVLQLHLLPRLVNMLALVRLRPATIFLWRNLGDALVSYDDHIRNESHYFPTFYVHDRENYLRMPEQERYRYLVRYAVPWYLMFYLGWRERGVTFRRYEEMVADPIAFFRAMIAEIRPGPLDEERLAHIIGQPRADTRFNAGVVGRSAERFSDETKRALEDTLLSHPEQARLRILLDELPWNATSSRDRAEGF
jgi:hypothetical protein